MSDPNGEPPVRGILALAARNTVFANLILVFFLLAGTFATTLMIREMFPVFALDIVSIRVPYPGADPQEVEEGICRKLEEALESVVGIKEYHTTAAEGVGTALIELDEDAADKEATKSAIRDRVEAISTFPPDAEEPSVAESFFPREVIDVVLAGDVDERVLKEIGGDIKDELRALPTVSQVELSATRPYEISIEVSEARLREQGLGLIDVSRAVRAGSQNIPSGIVRTRDGDIKVRTIGRRYTAEEFADLVVRAGADGTVVRLADIATIRDEFEENGTFATFDGERAVLIKVLANEGEDAIDIAAEVKAFVAERAKTLPETLHLSTFRDMSRMIQDRIDVLTKNGLLGFLLVFGLLWLFLDLRLAFWVGLGIPVSLAGGLVVVWLTGGSINMLSLFSMIMVVGIVVDDAVVVGESIYVHRRSGKPPVRAAIDGVREVWWPVTGGVTTTIIAFLPLFFVTGMMGKFFAVIPPVVIAALAMSLVESLFILPAHLNHLPEPGTALGRGIPVIGQFRRLFNRGLERFVERTYRGILAFCIHWRYAVVAGGVAMLVLSVGLVLGGFAKFVTFPKVDGDFIKVKVDFPDGTPAAVTQATVDRMGAAFRELETKFETLEPGKLIQASWATVGQQTGVEQRVGDAFGELSIDLMPSERRGVHSEAIKQAWLEELGDVRYRPKRIDFEDNFGGPSGKPIEIRLLSHDLAQLRAASASLQARLRSVTGVYGVTDDDEPGKRELRVRLRPLARTLGVTLLDLGEQVRAKWFGDEALRIQRGRDDIRIKIRYPERDRRTLGMLEDARIRTPNGAEVPLREVAELRLEDGYARINRQSGFRRITVTAEVAENKANAREIVQELRSGTSHTEPFLERLVREHPGVVYKLEGQQRDQQESVQSLFLGFLLVIVAIFVILATVFRSYVQPFLIICLIPMALIGVVVGHLVTGLTLTLLSMLGVVALAGVVVNDAIVFIDYYNHRIRSGAGVFDALVDTGARRFRAMFLTSMTTCFGLLPLMLETSFQAQILVPMAISISFGLFTATIATLLGLAPLLAILNDVRRAGRWLRTGWLVSRERAEPTHLVNSQ